MEHTALFCPSQTWTGPNVSTFSSEWDDSLNSYLLAPDVIKPPPQFQDPEEPCQSPPSSSAVIRRRDKERAGTGKQKEHRSRPASAMEPHRRSLSLSTALTSDPAVTRRRCESYALSYPSSSSEDSGSDSTSVRKGDQLPDAVQHSRARSIVLRKAKRKPAPPVRTVSLHRLTDLKPPERRTQSLYIPNDDQNVMLLPDLIPVLKAETGNSEQSTLAAEAPGKVPVNQPLSNYRPLKDLRSSEPCKSSSAPSGGTLINEATKNPYTSDCNNSPSSSRSSPSQPSISSPTKPAGSASPSSGYSSQCETPTQSASGITGPTALGCRMRPKSNAVPGQRARNSRTRLSLQLPEMQDARPVPNTEPSPVHSKANRRYSDTSATTRPKQRLSNSMLIMPVVTQEDLNNVRLRSVSSSDLDNTAASVIEEESERDGCFATAQQSPKAKPPVAPKPPVRKWPPNAVAKSSAGISSDADPPPSATSYGQDNIYSRVNKVKSNNVLPSSSYSHIDHEHHQVQQQYEFQAQQNVKEVISSQSLCTSGAQNMLSFNTACHTKPGEPQKKRRAPGPPVAKRPDMVCLPTDTPVNEHLDQQVQLSSSYLQSGSSQKEYHVTVYGFVPTYPHATEREQPNVPHIPVTEEGQIPDIGGLQLGGEEDEVFLHKSTSHTTEDLFTIIHRSKRKLLGRKDSFDNKQGDLGTQTIGVSKTSSQNDNFMALLRRTRSAKASSGSRISATELLKSSKPTAPVPTELTSYKNHYMMQSHGP